MLEFWEDSELDIPDLPRGPTLIHQCKQFL